MLTLRPLPVHFTTNASFPSVDGADFGYLRRPQRIRSRLSGYRNYARAKRAVARDCDLAVDPRRAVDAIDGARWARTWVRYDVSSPPSAPPGSTTTWPRTADSLLQPITSFFVAISSSYNMEAASSSSSKTRNTVYVSNIPNNADVQQILDAFVTFGKY